MKILTKVCSILLMFFLLLFTMVEPMDVSASATYPSYNYSFWEDTQASPAPYMPTDILDGIEEDYGRLSSPEDVFVSKDNEVYILDSGNNRIIVVDEDFEFIQLIEEFRNGSEMDTFNRPEGIFVTDEGHIYVADTNNQRVVHLDSDGTLVREIGRPESDVIRAGFEYYPRKIAVDKAERIYVVARGVHDGIIEFDSDGIFKGFYGANRVTFNPIEFLWRTVATRSQRAQMALFIPIEFNNLDIDGDGFVYTTNSERDTRTPIQRLNPTGTDVLRREGYHTITGDLEYATVGNVVGSSTFIDIDVNEYGMYSALDIRRGRVFTYDEDGNLLYIFGQLGEQRGTFRTPAALARLNDDILVLDKGFNRLTRFEPTEFGSLVNLAVMEYNEGNDKESADYWGEVLKLNSNYEVAYIGIGKAHLMDGQSEEALEFFENGFSRQYYSKAYQRHRRDVMREYFAPAMTSIVVLVLAFFGFKVYRRFKQRGKEGGERSIE